MSTILDEYIELDKKYKKMYGDETVILMEVGDFFELYGVQNDFETVGANFKEISDILNIRVTSRNKSVSTVDRKNPLMSGFPSYIVEKHIQTLIENNYTVVIVEQFENENTKYYKQFDRKVSRIITPSTYLSNTNTICHQSNPCNYLMICYWEIIKKNSQECLSLGVSLVDVTTGNTYFYECINKDVSSTFSLEEVYRIYKIYNPSELIHISFDNFPKLYQTKITEHLYQESNVKITCRWDIDNLYKKVRYQEECIRKSYIKYISFVSPIDVLKLEMKPLSIISFCYMIQYVYEHDQNLVSNLLIPEEIERHKNLSIEYNSAQQLNIINQFQNNQEKCLMKLLNRCCTSFGKRTFWNWLMSPILDIKELNRRYDCISYFLEKDLYVKIRKHLKNVYDIQSYFRKISINKLTPNEFTCILSSFVNIKNILESINNDEILDLKNDKIFADNFLEHINKILDINECSKYSGLNEIKSNIFKKDVNIEIDKLNDKIIQDIQFLKDISIYVENISGEKDIFKLETTDKQGYFYTITKKRWENFLQKLKLYKIKSQEKYDISLDLNKFVYKSQKFNQNRKTSSSLTVSFNDVDFDFETVIVKPVSVSSSNVKINSPKIDEISNQIVSNQNKIQLLVINEYKLFLKELFIKFEYGFHNLVKSISEIDVFCSNSINAFEFHYNKPQIVESKNSFIISKDIRHPIVERIQTQVKYVENDICLGNVPSNLEKNVKSSNGILLYGVNSSGKSTLMKSIGLNLIMAQSGMFVPCSNFIFSPYRHIFTRISGNDNIYKGMSSFTVEMTELKNILDRCDENSIILGDELCSGTEYVSALAIVASGILEILEKNSCFIFATHIHELCNLNAIKDSKIIEKIQIYHIHVDSDIDGNIIFNRKLKEGRGNSVYGLEICKFLKLPTCFLKNAEIIRKQIMDVSTNFIETKSSKYNSNVIIANCEICGYIPTNGIPLDTHHIIYQQTQDKNGFVKLDNTSFHKNKEHNLIPLCKNCHDDEHNGIIKIYGFVDTSNGRKIHYDKLNNTSIEELKKYILFENNQWKLKKTPKGKWIIVDLNVIENFIKIKNKNIDIKLVKKYFLPI